MQNAIAIASPGEPVQDEAGEAALPQEHDWVISVAAVLVPGKPTLVYSTTDAVAGHKVEILATAKRLNEK
jgi:hypothetical protein